MIVYALARHAVLLHLVTAASIRGALNRKNDTGGQAVVGSAFEDMDDSVGGARRLQETENRMLYCGMPNKCAKIGGNAVPRDMNLGAAVRCCTTEPSLGWLDKCRTNRSPRVYGESQVPACYVDATFEEAVGICAEAGGRLCSGAELMDRCAANSGCEMNKQLVWGCTPLDLQCTDDAECCDGNCKGGVCKEVKTEPTLIPSSQPTDAPTHAPTGHPTSTPTPQPTDTPTASPTKLPTRSPTSEPSDAPSESPTLNPTSVPSKLPTNVPSGSPTLLPTNVPSESPTLQPTDAPTNSPSSSPSGAPTTTSAPTTFVQPLRCPAMGSMDTVAPGVKAVTAAGVDEFCGIFVQKPSGDLVPLARSYDGEDWEPAPGPLAGTADSVNATHVVLPALENSADAYVILSKDGSMEDRKRIAKFLEMTTFGPKMSEIDALDDGDWASSGASLRAQYLRRQMTLPATSHREYWRKRANSEWDATTQPARSSHPCSPNSKWRKYTYTRLDRYDTNTEKSITTTFETVPEEADFVYSIYEADTPSDVSSYGLGVFRRVSGIGYYDVRRLGDFLEMTVTVPTAGSYPLSFRYARDSKSWNGNGRMQLWVNGGLINPTYDFVNTGGNRFWKYSKMVDVLLDAGNNAIKLVAHETDGANIDHLRIGKPPAVIMKTNGWPRTIAKNGISLLDDWPFEFTNATGAPISFKFSDYPGAKQGELELYKEGRLRIRLPNGQEKYLDIGNPAIDFTGYERYLPPHVVTFTASDIFEETSSDLYTYPMKKGQELLLTNGLTDPICDSFPSFAEEGDAPVLGLLPSGEYVQWTPTITLEDNGPSINDASQNTTTKVLGDGGGKMFIETGEKMKCSNTPRSFINEDTCFLSTDPLVCSANQAVPQNVTHGGVIVCGSRGEVSNDPALPETFDVRSNGQPSSSTDKLNNQKRIVWAEIALNGDDQLRQRMAWALAQVVTTVPGGIDGKDRTEIYLNYYDIFVRHAFGNYRDILAEASYSPLMAEHLSYVGSKSHSYVYQQKEKRISNADENYAREIMQLFSIGLVRLNDDGTPMLDPATGIPLETYTNDDIESFARSWTGFRRTAVRGNYEENKTGKNENRLDPLTIVPDWRDPFPKSNLNGGFIGDGYLLCQDLPDQAFLKKGAGYRLLGGKPSPELMQDPEYFTKDETHGILRAELDPTSSLYQQLYNGGKYELFVELENTLTCSPGTVECDVDTLRVVKVGAVYYEYVSRPCVQLAFYDDGKQVQLRDNRLKGQMCANPHLTHAREACCQEDRREEVKKAKMETGVTYFYEGERMTYDTAKNRCVAYGRDLCPFNHVATIPDNDDRRKGYHWTNQDCHINVKVNSEGYIAIVHDAMSSHTDTIPYLVEEDNTLNWFRVFWNDGTYPGDNEFNDCKSNGCKTLTDGSCLCKTTVEERIVFEDIEEVSREKVTNNLFLGALGPEDGSKATVIEDGLVVHLVGENVDRNTVFEIQDKGRTMYFKNMMSTVKLEGLTMAPQIYEAEDATISNAPIKDNTDSATGGMYVQARYGNEMSYIEWNVDAPVSGKYLISLRYAHDNSPRPLSVFINEEEIVRQLENPNPTIPLNNVARNPTNPSDRCSGDCDKDDHCGAGLHCHRDKVVPGCSGTAKNGWDYCADINDFDYGFTLRPTGGWTNDWLVSAPLQVDLVAGQNKIRVSLPPAYTAGPNIDHLKVEGLPTPAPSSSFRNPPHFMGLIPDHSSGRIGEQNLRDAQYETEAVLDHYFYQENVAPFMCMRIMQRFSFSNPSPRFVANCVTAFRTGLYVYGSETFGSGDYGSLEATIASILLNKEATSGSISSDPSYGNMREPMLKLLHLMRSMQYTAQVVDGSLQTPDTLNLWNIHKKIGQGPYDFPSVFSFFLSDYIPDSGPNLSANLASPESMVVTMPNVMNLLNGLFSLIKYGLSDCNGGFSTNPGFGNCNDDGLYQRSYGHLRYEPDGTGDYEQAANLSLLLTAGRLSEQNLNTIVHVCSMKLDGKAKTRCMQQLIVTTGEFHSTSLVTKSNELEEGETVIGAAKETTQQIAENYAESTLEETIEGSANGTTAKNSTEPYKAIVYFYLAGGLDSYHMLAPHTCANDVYDKYRTVRGKSSTDEGLGLPLDRLLEIPANNQNQPCTSFGINKDLSVMKELFTKGELSFIANAGLLAKPVTVDNYKGETHVKLFAHDKMSRQTKREDISEKFAGTGVGGRIADVLTEAGIPTNLFSVDGQQVILSGEAGQEGPTQYVLSKDGLPEFNSNPSIENMNAVIKTLNSNNSTTVDSGFHASTWSSKLSDSLAKHKLLKEELDKTVVTTSFPTTGKISSEFELITRVMQTRKARGSKRDIFFVQDNGYDTHSNVDEKLTTKFSQMNGVIQAFIDELKFLKLWESTVVVQFSEFGRTLNPNTGDGSDHAWGGHHFMFGGSVNGGHVLGLYPSDFEQGDDAGLVLKRGRMIPTTPWDAMWKGTAEWFGVPAAGPEMDKVLPMHKNFPQEMLYNQTMLFNSPSSISSPMLSKTSPSPVETAKDQEGELFH